MLKVGDYVKISPEADVYEMSHALGIVDITLRRWQRQGVIGRISHIISGAVGVVVDIEGKEFWFEERFLEVVDAPHDDLMFRVATSAHFLYTRFDLEVSPKDTYAVFAEEVREFSQAALIAMQEGSEEAKRKAALEAADVLYTLCGHVISLGIPPSDFIHAVVQKVRINDAKNLNTHYVDTKPDGSKKITRRALYIVAKDRDAAEQAAEGRSYMYVGDMGALIGAFGEILIVDADQLSYEQQEAVDYALALERWGMAVVTEV